MSSGPSAHRPRRSRGGRRHRVGEASRRPIPASRDPRAVRAPPVPVRAPWSSPSSPSAPHASKQKPSPDHGTRARGATRSWSAIAGGPSASAVTERPLVTAGFRAPLITIQGAVSRDPFAPLPPPGLPPLPGSLSVFRGLIAPARATFAKTVALGGGGPRRGRGPEHPALGSSARR